VRRLKREIRRLFHVHPEADWWLHFPGLGYLNAARLLVRIGDNRAAFPNVEMLRATAGTVPITRRSGKSQAVLFRRECSRPLRKSFSDLAMKSKRYASWAQDYYDAQLARGHSRTRANRALANRWVGIVWKLWQTGERYNEGLHQANRQKQLIREMRATA
jgi:transposase